MAHETIQIHAKNSFLAKSAWASPFKHNFLCGYYIGVSTPQQTVLRRDNEALYTIIASGLSVNNYIFVREISGAVRSKVCSDVMFTTLVKNMALPLRRVRVCV